MIRTHTYDWRHDITNRPWAAEATLNTTERSQNAFTEAGIEADVNWYENWMNVAVTLVKKVAMVDSVKNFDVWLACAVRISGTPIIHLSQHNPIWSFKNIPLSANLLNSSNK